MGEKTKEETKIEEAKAEKTIVKAVKGKAKKKRTGLIDITVLRTLQGLKVRFKASECLKPLTQGRNTNTTFFDKEVRVGPPQAIFRDIETSSSNLLANGTFNAYFLRVKECYERNGFEITSSEIIQVNDLKQGLERLGARVSKAYKTTIKPTRISYCLTTEEEI